MTRPSVSVVVVSRDRPDALTRCIMGLSQVQYDPFEIVVVADPAGIEAVKKMACADDVKMVAFDQANISAARNAGVVAAAGDVVAFIDDDAVPEPTWLHYLIAPFEQSDVAASGGFVIGRNGISFQWKARLINALGHSESIEVAEDKATVLRAPTGYAVKTEGTNMALRRDVLVELGGFDPAYHFYLDETDLNMRLARAGHATAICPRAQVHHGFAASVRRRPDRAPSDLFDIGASWAVFARKFIEDAAQDAHWKDVQSSERKRLLSHMVAGRLEPRQVRYLMKRLRAGHAKGGVRPVGANQVTRHASDGFKRFPVVARHTHFEQSTLRGAAAAREAAKVRVKNAQIVTLIILSRTAMYHHVQFNPAGFWEQKGGQFGKSLRNERIFQWATAKARTKKEMERVAIVRQV